MTSIQLRMTPHFMWCIDHSPESEWMDFIVFRVLNGEIVCLLEAKELKSLGPLSHKNQFLHSYHANMYTITFKTTSISNYTAS